MSTPRKTADDHRGRPGADRRGGLEARAAAPARRDHHGRQRPLGPAARAAADRRPPPGHPERPRGGRGGVPARARQLTLYCLSVENWKRPPRELTFLMRLLRHFLVVERAELMEQNVQLRMIGRREGLPADVLGEFDRTAEHDRREHRDDPLPGGQLRRPDRDRRRRAAAGRGCPRRAASTPTRSTRALFASYLDTAGMTDPTS